MILKPWFSERLIKNDPEIMVLGQIDPKIILKPWFQDMLIKNDPETNVLGQID